MNTHPVKTLDSDPLRLMDYENGVRNLNETIHRASVEMGREWRDLNASIFPIVDANVRPIAFAPVDRDKAWTEWREFQASSNSHLRGIFREVAAFTGHTIATREKQTVEPYLPAPMTLVDLHKMVETRAVIDNRGVRLLDDKTRLSLDYLKTIALAINGPGLPQSQEQMDSFLKGGEKSCQVGVHILGPLRAIARAHAPDPDDYFRNFESRDFDSRPRSPGKQRPGSDPAAFGSSTAGQEKIRVGTPRDEILYARR